MVLPTKHLRISESLLGLGAYILKYLKDGPHTIDQLWFKVSKQNNSKRSFSYHGFDNMVLALNYLFMIGAVDINSHGKVYNAVATTES